jgi:MFS family permease
MVTKITKANNFRLLQIAGFLQVFVLFYALEKLFVLSIGITNFQIGMLVALTSVSVLLFEFPLGVLADRWSRKYVLILASVALLVAELVGYFSYGFYSYGISIVFWGIYFAGQSGLYSSLTYDLILERGLDESDYDKYYGRIRIFEGLGLVVSSIAGGLIAESYGLRATYILSVPAAIGSIYVLIKFAEPSLHKREAHISSAWKYIREVLSYVKSSGLLMLTVLQMVIIGSIFTLGFEYNQLYYVALGLPVFLFGVANALMYASFGIGGYLAQSIRGWSMNWTKVILISAPVFAMLQFFVREKIGLVLPAILLTIFMALEVRFGRILHGQLPSKYRSSALSLSSTLSRTLSVGLALLFGWIIEVRDYFSASLILTFLAMLAVIIGLVILAKPAKFKRAS